MTAKITIAALQEMKREGRKIVGVVAWDYQMAQIADRAGVDIVSVGDTVRVTLSRGELGCEVTGRTLAENTKDTKGAEGAEGADDTE